MDIEELDKGTHYYMATPEMTEAYGTMELGLDNKIAAPYNFYINVFIMRGSYA